MAEQLQASSSDPDLATFCQSAYFVDEHAPFMVYGSLHLAVRADIPADLARLEPIGCDEDDDRITQQFRAPRWGDTTLWRCDIWCVDTARPIFSLVGTCNSRLLEELRRVRLITVVDLANWGRADPAMVELVVHNDPKFWETVTPESATYPLRSNSRTPGPLEFSSAGRCISAVPYRSVLSARVSSLRAFRDACQLGPSRRSTSAMFSSWPSATS